MNFKIPMKSNKKCNLGMKTTEMYLSPLVSDSDVQEEKSLSNGTSKNENWKEAIKEERPFKRKLNSTMPLYAGRNSLYPEELNNLILPLYCNLCKSALNSPKTAHFHYISKVHEKKIKNWLAEWSVRTGEPAPKIEKDEKKLSKESGVLFCQLCNTKLTSLQDAKQHYSGKKHASQLKFGVVPQNTGVSTNKVNIPLNNQRFGIGEGFKEEETEISSVESNLKAYCEICNIYTTSQHQLTIHFQGTKHLKKVKDIYPEETFADRVRDSQFSKAILNYRTPSGQFHCETCNVTVGDDKIFSQHLSSKRHKNSRNKQITAKADLSNK